MDSYFRNNYIAVRGGDEPLVVEESDGRLTVRMDGYVIVAKDLIPDVDAFLATLLPTRSSDVGADPAAAPV